MAQSTPIHIGTVRAGSTVAAVWGPFAVVTHPDEPPRLISPQGIFPLGQPLPSPSRDMAIVVAIFELGMRGHRVTEAEGVPGLFDVAGIGRDLTIGQMLSVAAGLPPEQPHG